MRSTKFTVKVITFSAVLIALAAAISFLSDLIPFLQMPQGGTVTLCSMLLIALIGYFYGPAVGVSAAVAYGLLNLALSRHFYYPAQVLIDYPIAYGALGLSGFFSKKKYGLIAGYLTGVAGRYIFVVLSGFVFFGSYAPEGQNPIVYSLIYNATYIAPEAAITVIILIVPAVRNVLQKVKTEIQSA